MAATATQPLIGASEVHPLRTRWMDPNIGRFTSFDDFEGNTADPASLHKYAYCGGDPTNRIDPSGHFLAMVGTMLGYSASILHFALDPGRDFQASWGIGRELAKSYDYGSADAFTLADMHAGSSQLQLMDIAEEVRRGVGVLAHSTQLAWDAIFETFDLNEQILLDLIISPFFASACFAAGTPIVVGINSDGSYVTKTIEDVRSGDQVLARDERNAHADARLRRVEAVFSRETDYVRVLTVSDDQGYQTTIRTTDGHLIWAAGRGWTKAGDLKAGDRLCDARSRESVVVVSSEREDLPEPMRVYTFRVEDDHTYFVSDAVGTGCLTVWVHNVCSGPAQYEEMMRKDVGVGNQSQAERTFRGVSGRTRIADALPTQGGTKVPYDAKWVRNGWAESPFNPQSALGRQPWARANQAELVSQAKDYVGTYGRAVYQSNSQEALSHFRDLFSRNGVDVSKIRFELVVR